MRNTLLIFICLLFSFAIGRSETPAQKGLEQHVGGLAPSYDIVTKHVHPIAYLGSLKVKDTTVILDGRSRYELARMLLDVHHLCQALSHQGYNVEIERSPILQLARTNFKGFEKCEGEGGYWTNKWAEFFQTNQIDWGVDSTFENQTKIQPSNAPAEGKTITLEEFRKTKIIGELGVPLHSIHKIECKIVDMSFTRNKGDIGRLALEIISVDDKPMEGKLYIDLPYPWHEQKPQAGTTHRFWAYETTQASGYPQEAFQKLDIPSHATRSLHFRPKLVVLKNLQ